MSRRDGTLHCSHPPQRRRQLLWRVISDVPGVFTAGDTIEAIRKAAEVLKFAAEDWPDLSKEEFPAPRTIDELRTTKDFQERAVDAVVAAVPFRVNVEAAA